MTSLAIDPPRVAVVVPYTTLWENVVQFDLRADRIALADSVVETFQTDFDCAIKAVISSPAEGTLAGEAAFQAGVEAVLVVETMGTQPSFTMAALEQLKGIPVVVWWAQPDDTLTQTFDHASIVTDGGAVGTPMLTNVLVRRGIPFTLVEGRVATGETITHIREAVLVSAAATRLRRSTIGRVGEPIEGYWCVDADEAQLESHVVGGFVRIRPGEVRDAYLAVDEPAISSLEEAVSHSFDVADAASGDGLQRSLRLAVAIEELSRRHALNAGVMNCHVPEIRFAEDVGVTPCFGLGRMTSQGIPWTCAGDVLTVIPMLALKLLGHGAVYHELEARDLSTLEFVVANTGEHDLSMATRDERPTLIPNSWFAGDPVCGFCACFSIAPGPAALVAFTQLEDRHRFIVAEGEITGRAFPGVGTVNGAFKFTRGRDAWIRWCEAGANHHSALTQAGAVRRILDLCRLLNIEVVLV